jgi:hypothetical protein
MEILIELVFSAIALVAAFGAGVLVGRKNPKKVESVIAAVKNPKDAVKSIF